MKPGILETMKKRSVKLHSCISGMRKVEGVEDVWGV
jgi:hypothetical protein